MKLVAAWIIGICLSLLAARFLPAQEQPSRTPAESLASLLAEAEHSNPQIQAARNAWNAAKQVPAQVSTLPDPEISVQQMSVGSPRPFSGYTNSEMANIALGFSQEIPYPGKLRLRGQIASKEAEAIKERYESVRRAVLVNLKTRYFRLSFLTQKLSILQEDGNLLRPMEQSAEARYRQGIGSQQDVLQAQLEETRLLRETTATQLEAETIQAQLKQELNRPQSSEDIRVEPLAETPLAYTYEQLLDAARSSNPDVGMARRTAERDQLRVDLARKDFYPDFTLNYIWLRPDPFQYRARYEISVGVRIPLFQSRRQKPALAQARLEKDRAQNEYEAQSQQVASDLRQQLAVAQKSADLLKIYSDGLMPQARAELQAGMAAYQSNREDFQALLASFLDVLKLDEEYWQTMSDRESALAQIEELTGLTLR